MRTRASLADGPVEELDAKLLFQVEDGLATRLITSRYLSEDRTNRDFCQRELRDGRPRMILVLMP
jgi:hypothetical protein